MILLVFEGQVGEPNGMTTLQHLYFSDAANYILCSYGTDTYTLWKDVKRHELDGEADVFAIMKERFLTLEQTLSESDKKRTASFEVPNILGGYL